MDQMWCVDTGATMKSGRWKLTSTQIGAIGEDIVASGLMIASHGRLSPFQPVADDDGIDLLIYDKKTGKALPIQVKSRLSVACSHFMVQPE